MNKFTENEFEKDAVIADMDFSDIEVISSGESILNIDVEELEANISEYKNGFDNDQLQEMLIDCRDTVINSIIGPFGLSATMFENKDGGNVTTVFNFAKGVTSTEDDRARYTRFNNNKVTLDRKEIDKDYKKKREAILERNSAVGNKDAYTNQILEGVPSVDHVKSVATTLRDPKPNLAMDDKQLVNLVNSDENLVVTSQNINSSKQDKTAQNFANAQASGAPEGITNKDKFDLDMDAIKELEDRSAKQYKDDVNKALFIKQSKELLKTGAREAGLMAVRRAVGLLLQEFVQEGFVTVRICIDRFKSNAQAKFKQLFSDIWEGLKRLAERIKKKAFSLFKDAATSGISGIFSNLFTFIINNFITTAKNAVALIREVFSAIVATTKVLANKADADRFKKSTKIMLTALATCSGIFLLEAVKKFLETTPLNPFSLELGNVIVGIVTGLSTILLLFIFNKIKNNVNMTNKALVAAESGIILNQYKAYQTIQLLDNAMRITGQKNSEIAIAKESIDSVSQSQINDLTTYSNELDLQEKELLQLLASLKDKKN